MKVKNRRLLSLLMVCVLFLLQGINCDVYANEYANNEQNVQIQTKSYENADVAIIHFNPQLNKKEDNIVRLEVMIERAFNDGAEIILAPELSTTGYLIDKENVVNGLGITNPEEELKNISDLAKKYEGYICMGYAEITEDNHTYNSAVLFGPDGMELNQRKRTLPGWNERGNKELTTIETEYGNIGVIICADSYSPDYTRLLALNGADIILLPCTWWGDEGQLSTWKTRARENGVWMVIGNRWGSEYDNYYEYDVDMNDAPSAIISPDGEAKLVYTKNDDDDMNDKILMYSIKVDTEREVYSLMYRSPNSYQAIENEFYRPTLGNTPVPGLPKTGTYNTIALSYVPNNSAQHNLNKIESLLNENDEEIDIVTLPAYGLTKKAISCNGENLEKNKDIQKLQDLVDEREIELLITQINVKDKNKTKIGILVLQESEEPLVVGQLHDEVSKEGIILGTHGEPFYLDLENARVGVITGNDYMFPETITSLAKMGTDIVLISSDVIDNEKSKSNYSYVSNDYMENSIATLISHCVHMAISDCSGYAEVIESQWGIKEAMDIVNNNEGTAKLNLDTSLTRYKYLQEYLPVDIETLIKFEDICNAA